MAGLPTTSYGNQEEGGSQKLQGAGKCPTYSSGNARGVGGEPLVALTFDDGPHPTLTPRLLDILSRQGVKATFYLVGDLARQHPDIVLRMHREGHEIGNHTWTHRDLRKLGSGEIRSELERTAAAIEHACGQAPFSTRPPYGGMNKRVADCIGKEFQPVVLWTVDPLDWKRPGSEVVKKRLVEGAAPGSILLCHDIHSGTVDAIEDTIRSLRKSGYRFAKVSEILASRQTLDLDADP